MDWLLLAILLVLFVHTLLYFGATPLASSTLAVVLWLMYMFNRTQPYTRKRKPDEHYKGVDARGTPFGVSAMQGRRPYMEDAVVHEAIQSPPLEGASKSAFSTPGKASVFGVFDGHGGARASEYAVAHIPNAIETKLKGHPPKEALRQAFLDVDKGFLRIANQERLYDGSTATVALIMGKDLYVANAGDSRTVLVRGSGEAVPMSVDHKPNLPSERSRIVKAGGSVRFNGCWRVNGVLATSRGFGDRELKKVVTAEPDVQYRKIDSSDKLLILASDGVFDVMSNEKLANMAAAAAGPLEAAQIISQYSMQMGSMDNVSALVIDLQNKQDPSESAQVASTASGQTRDKLSKGQRNAARGGSQGSFGLSVGPAQFSNTSKR